VIEKLKFKFLVIQNSIFSLLSPKNASKHNINLNKPISNPKHIPKNKNQMNKKQLLVASYNLVEITIAYRIFLKK
jgi:hypothetical protein